MHLAEIWCVVDTLTMSFTQTMSRGYLHRATEHLFQSHLFTFARSSPKRRLTGHMLTLLTLLTLFNSGNLLPKFWFAAVIGPASAADKAKSDNLDL